MSIVPAPTSARGEITLQPAYFTSSIYVKSLRDDITNLIHKYYYEHYIKTRPAQPFSLFKAIWEAHGWKLLHFKVFDDRARKTFLDVTLRLFLERTVKTEAPFCRAVALFGMYTFFSTQPKNTAPPLYSVSHIGIPIDHFMSLKGLPQALISPEFQPLQQRVAWILSELLKENVFLILPESDLGAMNPRNLPREVYVDGTTGLAAAEADGVRKKGRPTKRDKAQKAKAAVESLDRWLERTSWAVDGSGSDSEYGSPATTHRLIAQAPSEAMRDYQDGKLVFLKKVYGDGEMEEARDVIEKANKIIVGRLREAQEVVGVGGSGDAGLERVERAVEGQSGGLLKLLEGAGRRGG